MTEPAGLILLLTGEGKGKTTSALGQALRASGQGLSVLFIQFLKGDAATGEYKAVQKTGLFRMVRFGRTGFVNPSHPEPEDYTLAKKGLEQARKAAGSGNYDMIVLDEILAAVQLNLLPVENVISLIKNKPSELHLVLTGREAHPDLAEMADLVSHIQSVRHPFDKGMGAQPGIEY